MIIARRSWNFFHWLPASVSSRSAHRRRWDCRIGPKPSGDAIDRRKGQSYVPLGHSAMDQFPNEFPQTNARRSKPTLGMLFFCVNVSRRNFLSAYSDLLAKRETGGKHARWLFQEKWELLARIAGSGFSTDEFHADARLPSPGSEPQDPAGDGQCFIVGAANGARPISPFEFSAQPPTALARCDRSRSARAASFVGRPVAGAGPVWSPARAPRQAT